MFKKKFKAFLPAIAIAVSAPFVVMAAGDFENPGERLARTCSMCHGTNGATPGEYSPIIGGQNSAYLAKQLLEYKSDAMKDSPMMNNVAKGFTDTQIKEIASVLASKKWVNTTHKADADLAAKGKKLAEDLSCDGCHGEMGKGMDDFPRIAGQNEGFLELVLERYKKGERTSDDMGFMNEISDEDIKALSAYYSSIK